MVDEFHSVRHTVLVLGGYGFFGERISAALSRNPRIRLLIAGRRIDKCVAAVAALGLPRSDAVALDATDPQLVDQLTALGVQTMVHTAGPFQRQGYEVARAAIQAGCNYIDLADGRHFVSGIETLDREARTHAVTVISGASSVPALSSAVVKHLRPQFARVDAIRVGIASGARAPGLATVRGVFGYCGKPIRRLENGTWVTTYGWLDLHRHRFPPPLGSRWMGSCDVPDLELFPRHYDSVHTVAFHAGFASDVGHLVVWSLAALTKAKIIRDVTAFAPLLNRISCWIEPIVSDKGGMFVTLDGIGHDGSALQKTWSLLAARNHGPYIPCGGAIALVNKLVAGNPLQKGAMPCVELLTVKEYLEPLRELEVSEVSE